MYDKEENPGTSCQGRLGTPATAKAEPDLDHIVYGILAAIYEHLHAKSDADPVWQVIVGVDQGVPEAEKAQTLRTSLYSAVFRAGIV